MPTVLLAVLAEFAKPSDQADRLHIIGAGIRSVTFPMFPGGLPRLSLAVGLEFTSTESKTAAHSLQITGRGVGERSPVKPLTASFIIRPDETQPDEPVYFNFVYNMENLVFPTEGVYVFSVTVDDALITEVPLRVLKAAGPIPRTAEASIKLSEGYEAFAKGDAVIAQRIFEEVVEQYPEIAGGHNNLGFVLLAQDRANDALAAFSKARELGFAAPHLLDVNVGCAHYVRGDPSAAAIFFEQCLRIYGFEGRAYLFGIGESHLFPAHLTSASDYVSLLNLNLAWSMFRAGDRIATRRYFEGAQSAGLTRREDESGRGYAASLQALEKLIGR
jgi:hypothetical protein